MKQRTRKLEIAWIAFHRVIQRAFYLFLQRLITPLWTTLKRLIGFLLNTILISASAVKSSVTKVCFDDSYQSFRLELEAALFIASLVLILEHHHLLESLEQDNLQLALPFLYTFSDTATPEHDIKTILIDDATYETRFKQESPLDRSLLTGIIGELLRHEPKVLVIDLDLSPGPPGNHTSRSTAESELYSLIKSHHTKTQTEIILITPQPVFDRDFASNKATWMKEMCGPHVHFALPDIPIISGLALRYDNTPTALAVQVERALSGSSSTDPICTQDSTALTRYTRKNANTRTDESDTELLNYRFVSSIAPKDLKEACPGDKCSGAELSGSVLFFGGRYSPTDSYNTPVGILSGALLHAGSFYSIKQPIGKTNHPFAYLLDIMMGCILGMIIFKLASMYREQQSLAAIVLNLVVQPIFPYLMIIISGLMLSKWNLWLNPAPMIFGMAIHAGLVRIEEPYVKHVSNRKFLGVPETRIKQCIYFAVVLVAWMDLASEYEPIKNLFEHGSSV